MLKSRMLTKWILVWSLRIFIAIRNLLIRCRDTTVLFKRSFLTLELLSHCSPNFLKGFILWRTLLKKKSLLNHRIKLFCLVKMKFLESHFSGPDFYMCQLQVLSISRTVLLGFFSRKKLESMLWNLCFHMTCSLNWSCFFYRPVY